MKSCVLAFGIVLFSLISYGQYDLVSQEMGIYIKHENTEWGNGASFYDFNHDGWDDLTSANGDSLIQFFQNDGSGNLIEVEFDLPVDITAQVIAVIWVDYDNDGDSDLFFTQYGGRVYLLNNDGAFNFLDVTEFAGLSTESYKYYGVSFADVNKDGYLDFYLSKYYNNFVNPDLEYSSYFYMNNGNGTFSNATITAGLLQSPSPSFQSVFFDYDTDGDLDLFIIVDRNLWPNELFRNNGNGTFTEVSDLMGAAVGVDSMCATVGDYDNDLDFDIYITDGQIGNVLLTNNFPQTFVNQAELTNSEVNLVCWGSNWIDADNNGFQDLFVATTIGAFSSAPNKFLINNGLGSFNDLSSDYGFENDQSPSMCSVIGDINNDGYFEIFNNNNDPFYSDLWISQGGSNNFLGLTLEGTISNRDAVGTSVKAYFGDMHAIRLKQFGEAYIAQNSGKEIFGLGENEMVDSLIIQWPNGLVEKYFNLVGNQTYHFIEGNASQQIFQLVSSETSICPGQTITLDAGEAASYLWSDGTTDRYNYVTEPGDYQVEVTDENGIVYLTNLISIIEQTPPTVEVTALSPTCNGYSNGVIEFDYTYDENTLLYFNDQIIFDNVSNLPAGEYSYSIISQSGCFTDGVVILNEPEFVSAEFNVYSPPCAGILGQIDVFNISGGTPPYFTDYFEQDPTAVPEGDFLFLVIDNQGCPFVGEYSITIPVELQLSASSTPQISEIPGQIVITALGGTGQLEYFIDEISIGTSNTSEALTGIHTVTVVDENGCSQSMEIEVGFEVSINEKFTQFNLFPNPTSNFFTLEVTSESISQDLEIYSSTGALIMSKKINSFKTNIDSSNWSEGIYLVKIGNQQRTLIKQ